MGLRKVLLRVSRDTKGLVGTVKRRVEGSNLGRMLFGNDSDAVFLLTSHVDATSQNLVLTWHKVSDDLFQWARHKNTDLVSILF